MREPVVKSALLGGNKSRNYQLWAGKKAQESAKAGTLRPQAQFSQTSRHKDEIQKTMDQIISYSPEYKLKKLNNYDNTVLNVSRQIFENCDLNKDIQGPRTRNSFVQS